MCRRYILVWLLAAAWTQPGCRGADEEEARLLCGKAEALEGSDPRGALELKKRIWEQMPTAGTAAASNCLRSVREKLGRVRVAVAEDVSGGDEAVEGCVWAVNAMEVFKESSNPPFRWHWGQRLMERCLRVVGRAWTRDPDDTHFEALHRRLKTLAAK